MGQLIHLIKNDWNWYLEHYPQVDVDDKYFPFKVFLKPSIIRPELTRWVADNVDQQALITDWAVMQYYSYDPDPPFNYKHFSTTLALLYFSDLSECTAFALTFGDHIHTTFLSDYDSEVNNPKIWTEISNMVKDRAKAPKFPVQWDVEHQNRMKEYEANIAKQVRLNQNYLMQDYDSWLRDIEEYKKKITDKFEVEKKRKEMEKKFSELSKKKATSLIEQLGKSK